MTMISEPETPFFFRCVAIFAIAGALTLGTASIPRAAAETLDRFAPPRDEPALIGHGAEAAQREAEAEALHRRLFFDPAERESGEAGVSCDHRAATRPDTIAGHGRVLVAFDMKTARILARLWVPPDETGRPALDEAGARAHLLASTRPTASSRVMIAEKTFAWCR